MSEACIKNTSINLNTWKENLSVIYGVNTNIPSWENGNTVCLCFKLNNDGYFFQICLGEFISYRYISSIIYDWKRLNNI